MRGRVGNREITIIAKTNIFYKLIWIPLSFKDKEGEENWRKYKGNSFFWQNRLNKNSTWILNWKFHYIFLLSDRAHSKTKNNWTKCRPFQEGMFYSIVWFTQAKHCKRDAPISKRPSAWDIFSQSNAAHVPLPVTLLSVHSSYTPFRNTNKFLRYITAFGIRHECRSSSYTHGIITNIHWNMRCGLSGKGDNHEKKVFTFL